MRLIAWFFVFSSITNLYGQGFTVPSNGKSVVYFARISNYQIKIPFDLFDGARFIADFPGRNYFRYECEPGTHLFWVSGENKSFLTADLKPDRIYIVLIDARAGQAMAQAVLVPIFPRHKEVHKAKWLIRNKEGVTENQDTLKEENTRMEGFIQRTLADYEKQSVEHMPEHLSGDMDFPFETLQ